MRGLSIIIPAHNEAAVIDRTLRSILASPLDRPLQVIVVANGCTDRTAAIARQFGPPVEVIDTPIGSKSHALNLGDEAALYFPRAYMDADVEVSANLLQGISDAMEHPSVRLASPGVRHIYEGRNPLLRGYYRLWSSLPYVQQDTTARGFFAIDRALRGRFERFPDLIADDRFIRNLARPEERRVVSDCWTTVRMPRTFADLIRVKTRWTMGNRQLAEARPDLQANDAAPRSGGLGHLLRHPSHWPHVPTFVAVFVMSRLAVRRRLKQDRPAWDRAESSRGRDHPGEADDVAPLGAPGR